jgi:zinc transport system substrate-binding protein
MLRKWLIVLLFLVGMVGFSACNTPEILSEEDALEENRLKVSVTFDAMQEFVQAIGKDKVEISTIIPTGADSHSFEPKVQDLININKADIFIYNGLGMEEWAEDAFLATDNPDLIMVDSSEGADLLVREATATNHEHEHEDDHDHSHGKYDPHLWLGIKGAQVQIKNIKDALIEADPSNGEYYEQNYKDFNSELENLYSEYSRKFEALERRTFVTGHAAFGYLCRDFDLVQNSVRDVFAEGEPSAQQLTQLIEYCRENKITTIFTEEKVSPEVSQTLANEVNAKVEIIYTMESPQDNMTYLERMESNLSKIYESLIH